MDEATLLRLLALYWEHYERSKYRKYNSGFADGMAEVFAALGIDPDPAMPEHLRVERKAQAAAVRALCRQYGIVISGADEEE